MEGREHLLYCKDKFSPLWWWNKPQSFSVPESNWSVLSEDIKNSLLQRNGISSLFLFDWWENLWGWGEVKSIFNEATKNDTLECLCRKLPVGVVGCVGHALFAFVKISSASIKHFPQHILNNTTDKFCMSHLKDIYWDIMVKLSSYFVFKTFASAGHVCLITDQAAFAGVGT